MGATTRAMDAKTDLFGSGGYGAAPLEDPDALSTQKRVSVGMHDSSPKLLPSITPDENSGLKTETYESDVEDACCSKACCYRWCKVAGPGLVVMLADTDVGSIVTAAQSGCQWGYHTLGVQLLLIPILYITQNLTVKLGVITGQGHGELIRERYGAGWAWLSVSTLVVACIGATICEISGIVGVGLIAGVPRQVTAPLVGVCLLAVAFTGSYRTVERAALCIGLFECAFFITMFMGEYNPGAFFEGIVTPQVQHGGFLFLCAANIGAVIMPWMIFYQQSAVLDKGITVEDLPHAEIDTLVGSFITQGVMIAVTITTASTMWEANADCDSIDDIQELSDALTPRIGVFGGRVCYCLAVFGAGSVAAIVVSLTAAWGLGEAAGYARSLECSPAEAPWFYAVYTGVVGIGVGMNMFNMDIVQLNLDIQVMNCLLLPIVLGFLFLLAVKQLPDEHKLQGWYMWFVGTVYTLLCVFGCVAGIWGVA